MDLEWRGSRNHTKLPALHMRVFWFTVFILPWLPFLFFFPIHVWRITRRRRKRRRVINIFSCTFSPEGFLTCAMIPRASFVLQHTLPPSLPTMRCVQNKAQSFCRRHFPSWEVKGTRCLQRGHDVLSAGKWSVSSINRYLSWAQWVGLNICRPFYLASYVLSRELSTLMLLQSYMPHS